VIQHCRAVAEKTIELAEQVSIPLDKELLIAGAMLHDIGRCRTHSLSHILAGAEIAREEGLPEEVSRIIERHAGAGITREEAEKLGLPPKSYLPETPEEILVSYADNLTEGTRHVTYREALERFKRKLGPRHPSINRLREQHKLVLSWMDARRS